MKKSLLAMAFILGGLGTVQASTPSTGVILYGTIDSGVGFKNLKNRVNGAQAKKVGMFGGVWSSNSIGFKGTENLGDGWSAKFELEKGFDSLTGDNSGDRAFKTTTLGLVSQKYGSFEIGRMGNAVQGYAGFIAGPDDEEGLSDITNIFSAAGSNKVDNVLLYTSPTWQGTQFAVGYSDNAQGTQTGSKSKLLTSAISYSKGPLSVVLGYDRLKASDWDQAVHSWIGAASYEIKGVTLAMAVGQDIHGLQGGVGSYFAPSPLFQYWEGGYIDKKFKTTGFTLNATMPVGKNGSFMAGWATSRLSSSYKFDNNTDSSFDSKLGKRRQNIYSAGYSQNLSKRTLVYALWSQVSGFSYQKVRGQQFIVGLDHSF